MKVIKIKYLRISFHVHAHFTFHSELVTCGVFLDFFKAFDTVNHNILLSKLYHYGIRGLSFNWFENYLHNRTQFVKIGSTQSNPETITCGIPQGST